MREKKAKSMKRKSSRKFESDAKNLYSMRLIAAPRPEDDLSDEQLVAVTRNCAFSTELIQHLIEKIKMI